MNPKQIGLEGELKAIQILRKLGFMNIEHSKTFYDIYAEKEGKKYFYEVKTRSKPIFQIPRSQLERLRGLNGIVFIVCISKNYCKFISLCEVEKEICISSDQSSITISGLSIDLLKKIDASAEKNQRDRSKEIVFVLEQFYHTK